MTTHIFAKNQTIAINVARKYDLYDLTPTRTLSVPRIYGDDKRVDGMRFSREDRVIFHCSAHYDVRYRVERQYRYQKREDWPTVITIND